MTGMSMTIHMTDHSHDDHAQMRATATIMTTRNDHGHSHDDDHAGHGAFRP